VKPYHSKRVSCMACAAAIFAASGCATTANNPKDPFEGFNRAMFAVNEGLDLVVKPVAQGYDAAAPLPVKVVVGNFFGNIWDVWTAVNNLLQGKASRPFPMSAGC
jgi:phospholipid-binding lipoprotein MlaA